MFCALYYVVPGYWELLPACWKIQGEDSRFGGKPGVGWADLHGNWETGTWPYIELEWEREENILIHISQHSVNL